MTLVEAVRQMLIDAGLQHVYIIDCPETGAAVLITPYESIPYDGVPVGEQRFQVYCAAATYPASEALAWQAFRAIEDGAVPECDREVVGLARAIQEPFYLDKDDYGRYIHEFNAAISAVWKGEN
ncbi:minor capsid protein [Synergistes jonesii]|uniref:Phage protein n=1 Tax=Synergistes jonesii TaxID=2754 RepID=A0A073IMV8_9BACT|nr:minor capsid protein [Synergistes jonesii]KEJ91688.1 hypothetical protein EH55_06845 [Synergistes jonesii]MDY2985879.1 minor capsid protein [Synergistes jonesii]OFB61764.1 hypothetical protein JS73_08955 [Synergistes jonesii]OFB64144.1 hypothetical protein JS72_05510 [Synergistes jonesii]OFB67265.1 hypothetical protein JS78_08965 [Synergistes jonesii]